MVESQDDRDDIGEEAAYRRYLRQLYRTLPAEQGRVYNAKNQLVFREGQGTAPSRALYRLPLEPLLQQLAPQEAPADELPHADTRFVVSAGPHTPPPALADKWRQLGPYLQRVLARPAVIRAFNAEGLAAPWV